MNTKEMIEVMQAYGEGAEIEIRLSLSNDDWEQCHSPLWDWYGFDYRVKSKKKVDWTKMPEGVLLEVVDKFGNEYLGYLHSFYSPDRVHLYSDGEAVCLGIC